jgi:hypothetical protein
MPDSLDDKLDAIARQPFRAKFHLHGRDRVTAELRARLPPGDAGRDGGKLNPCSTP